VATTSIADMIRSKVDVGTLPRKPPIKLWASPGNEQPCIACEQPILKSQVEYELEYERPVAIRLHSECYGIWEATLR
jgi:hypothetical protein